MKVKNDPLVISRSLIHASIGDLTLILPAFSAINLGNAMMNENLSKPY